MIVMALFILSAFGGLSAEPPPPSPQRIISLAPSTTEIAFALGLGDRLVGVTRYCDYPPEARRIAKVGGYLDPSYEGIVALKPDLTILLSSDHEAKAQLGELHLRTLAVPHQTIKDIHEAIFGIGEACGEGAKAETLLKQLSNRTHAVACAIKGKDRPRVLICIGRDVGSDQLTGMYVAGRNGFYDQIINLAGGINACPDTAVAYPQLSAEGVLRLNPEVIVDLLSEMSPGRRAPKQAGRQWAQMGMVDAVRNKRVHVLVGNQTLRPGPRYIDFLEQMARLLHPEDFISQGSYGEYSAAH
jgi:iron complex transport system substrate-binding protein